MTPDQREWSRTRDELVDAVESLGFPKELGDMLQQEQNKLIRKERSKKEREEESDRLFAIKQQTKKEKHKGH